MSDTSTSTNPTPKSAAAIVGIVFANVTWFKRRTRLRMWRDIVLAYAAITAVWFAIIAVCG